MSEVKEAEQVTEKAPSVWKNRLKNQAISLGLAIIAGVIGITTIWIMYQYVRLLPWAW